MKRIARTLLLATIAASTAGAWGAPPAVSAAPAVSRIRIRLREEYRHLKLTPLPGAAALAAESATADSAALEALPEPQKARFARITAALWAGRPADLETARNTWRELIQNTQDATEPVDIDALIRAAVREVCLAPNPELRLLALRANLLSRQRALLEEHLAALRAERNRIRADAHQTALWDRIGAEIRRFEENLESVGEDAQLANVDLQNMLQKQQQTMQMLSTISKLLHDTAMAVIRKIGE